MTTTWTIRHRLLPSFSDLIFSTTLALLFLLGQGATGLLHDSDTGWHIRTGEWILQNLAVPRQDMYSFSKPGGQWFAWEWLSDVILAVVHQQAGLGGVVLLAGLIIAVTFTMLYRLLLRRGINVLLAVALALAAYYASSIHWLARPHVFGWPLALICYWLLEEIPAESRRLFWLVPLIGLWTNLHGSFLAGLLLIAVYGGAELIRAALDPAAGARRDSLARAARYGMLLAGCSLASLINPYGLQLHRHIYSYLNDSYILNQIGEYSSPNFHWPAVLFFEALLLTGFGACLWAIRRGLYAQAMVVAVFAHYSLRSARHVPLYVILAAPLIGAALSAAVEAGRSKAPAAWLRRLLDGFDRMAGEVGRIEARPRAYAVSVLPLLLVIALLWAPPSATSQGSQIFRPRFNEKVFPVGAADFLEKAAFQGKVFATDQWSSYMIYRAFPDVRVFMDGRSDYYGPEMGRLYVNTLSAHHTWQATLDRYGVDSVLLPVDSGLVGTLKESSRWRVAYDDGTAIVFFPRVPGAAARLVAAAQDTDWREQPPAHTRSNTEKGERSQ